MPDPPHLQVSERPRKTPRTLRVLGVIPARGGSRGIPGKNVAEVAGKPLITHTIEAAKNAGMERVIVSTDSERIAAVARDCGAEVPFLRPPELARDDTPGIDPLLHAVRWLEERENYRPDYVALLQPTSPLRTAADIDAALEIAGERQAEAVVSVCAAHQHPRWMKRITGDGLLENYLPADGTSTRRQDLPPAYALNGAIYIARRDVLLEQRTFYTDRTYAYVMPAERSLDVDEPWELYLADLILRDRGGRQ